jgi:hypothetical protein
MNAAALSRSDKPCRQNMPGSVRMLTDIAIVYGTLGINESFGGNTMNDAPHILAIIESKMAQVRTRLEHNSHDKAKALLAEVKIYAEDLRHTIDA